jgi:hypothetical protein
LEHRLSGPRRRVHELLSARDAFVLA